MFNRPKPRSSKRRRNVVVLVVVVVVAIIVVSVTLEVLYTVPLVSGTRANVSLFGNTTTSFAGSGPPHAQYMLPSDLFCRPSDAVGNLTVTIVWNASGLVNSAQFGWEVDNGPSNITVHFFYWANNSTKGSIDFAPNLEAQICAASTLVVLRWLAQPGIVIVFSGVSEYDYPVTEPIL